MVSRTQMNGKVGMRVVSIEPTRLCVSFQQAGRIQ